MIYMKEISVINKSLIFIKIYNLMDIERFNQEQNKRNWIFGYLFDDQSSYKRQKNDEQFDRYYDWSIEHFNQTIQILQPKDETNKITNEFIFDANRNELQELSSTSRSESNYRPKKDQQKKSKQYPTKNMLPAIMPLFRQYLESELPHQMLNSIQEFRDIKAKKNRINLQSFVNLFSVQDLRPTLATYFKEKRIYRDLLKLRIHYPRKLSYFKRIEIFEQAFITLKFEKIN